MKLLLWGVIAGVVIMLLMRGKKVAGGSAGAPSQKASHDGKHAEPMVQCAHCGTHIPSSEALPSPTGLMFCSEAHRLQHARP